MISGQQTLTDIIAADHKELLTRLHGLETLIFNDGTCLSMSDAELDTAGCDGVSQ
ncbi:hypothetical protein ACI0X4_001048 [Cronobacter turicensis]